MKELAQFIKIDNDETAIFDYLIDHDLMPKKIYGPFAVTRYIGNDLVFIAYFPNNPESKFIKINFYDFALNEDLLVHAIKVFHQFAEEDYFTYKPAENKLLEAYYMMMPMFRRRYELEVA